MLRFWQNNQRIWLRVGEEESINTAEECDAHRRGVGAGEGTHSAAGAKWDLTVSIHMWLKGKVHRKR